MLVFSIIFLAAVAFFLGLKLGCNDTPPQPPMSYKTCLDFIKDRNTPDNILSCIDFVGKKYSFDITTDFRLLDLRDEYELLRGRIEGLSNYLLTDIGQKDKEYANLRQQLATMYMYLEILELRCINQQYLIPNDIQEES